MKRVQVGLAMAAILAVTGCGLKRPSTGGTATSGGHDLGQPVTHFPNKQELQAQLKGAPAPAHAPEQPTASVQDWEIIETPAEPSTAYCGHSRWDRLMVDDLAGTRVVPSEALRCAAQEAARYYVQNGGFPDEAMRRFLVVRCGSSLAATSAGTLYASTTGVVSEQKIAEQFSTKLRELVGQMTRIDVTEVGLGFAQSKDRLAFYLLGGRSQGRIESQSMDPEGEQVELSGSLPTDAAFAMGLVTQGAYGVRRCEPDRSVSAPRFRVSCPLAKEDELALVEVVGRRATDMLWNVVLRHAVRRQPTAGRKYSAGSSATAATPEQFVPRLLEAINDTRKRMGNGLLEAIAEQSVSNQELSHYIYDATTTNDRARLEFAVLGVLAGWDVPGAIRDGAVYWAGFEHASSPERWLAAALDSPFGRSSLLDAKKTRVAIGAHHYGKSSTMAVVSTYELFGSSNHDQDELALFKEISAIRKARGKTEPGRVARSELLTAALGKVARREASVQDAVDELLQRYSQQGRRSVQAWVVETNNLFQLPSPEPLLTKNLNLEVGVTHYKPEGAAWGQYVIVFLLHDTNVATALWPGQCLGANPVRLARSSIGEMFGRTVRW